MDPISIITLVKAISVSQHSTINRVLRSTQATQYHLRNILPQEKAMPKYFDYLFSETQNFTVKKARGLLKLAV